MGLIHGRSGLVYLQGVGSAVALLHARRWMFKTDNDLYRNDDFTGMWAKWLPQPMTWSGTIEGLLDTSETTPFDAVSLPGATTPQKALLFLYPDRNNTSRFYNGLIWPKITVDVNYKNVDYYVVDFIGEDGIFYT